MKNELAPCRIAQTLMVAIKGIICKLSRGVKNIYKKELGISMNRDSEPIFDLLNPDPLIIRLLSKSGLMNYVHLLFGCTASKFCHQHGVIAKKH